MVPLPMPPNEGLQLHTPELSRDGVTSIVRAPVRAAAAEASHPAWPPPITTTSAGGTSVTEAKVRRKAAADRTRGAWPQSTRARGEKASVIGMVRRV